MYLKEIVTAILSPKDLVLTREDLDVNKVASMVNGLRGGELPEELTRPLVRPMKGKGIMVADGNHSVKAMQEAGVDAIEVDVYQLNDET